MPKTFTNAREVIDYYRMYWNSVDGGHIRHILVPYAIPMGDLLMIATGDADLLCFYEDMLDGTDFVEQVNAKLQNTTSRQVQA